METSSELGSLMSSTTTSTTIDPVSCPPLICPDMRCEQRPFPTEVNCTLASIDQGDWAIIRVSQGRKMSLSLDSNVLISL